MTRHDSNSDEALIEAIGRGDEDAVAIEVFSPVREDYLPK